MILTEECSHSFVKYQSRQGLFFGGLFEHDLRLYQSEVAMSRTEKGSKGPGYDYGAARPGNNGYENPPGRYSKTRTHRLERLEARADTEERLEEFIEETRSHPASK